MPLRGKKFTTGQRVMYNKESIVTVQPDERGQARGTTMVRNQYGYLMAVKTKDLEEIE